VFLDEDYAALMEIGEIMGTHGGHLKYVLVSCRDGKFVSRFSRDVFVTAVPIPCAIVYIGTLRMCAVGRLKVGTNPEIYRH